MGRRARTVQRLIRGGHTDASGRVSCVLPPGYRYEPADLTQPPRQQIVRQAISGASLGQVWCAALVRRHAFAVSRTGAGETTCPAAMVDGDMVDYG
jgi:hypothetical protein